MWLYIDTDQPNLSVQCVVVGFWKLNVNEIINSVPEREIQVQKHNESQIISRDFIMDGDFLDRSAQHPWSLSRVTGRNLDPRKHWYVATKSLCGVRPNAFAKNEIFRRFPDEIRSVPSADLKPAARACSFDTRQPNNFVCCIYVRSLCGTVKTARTSYRWVREFPRNNPRC